MRVYLPSTLPLLAAWLERGGADRDELRAHAVTPELREVRARHAAAGGPAGADADVEGLEHEAYENAVVDSLRLLAVDDAAPRRRVVVAADVPDDHVVHVRALLGDIDEGPDAGRDVEPAEPSAVRVVADVPIGSWAAVHADDEAAEYVVTEAVAAVGAADMGDAESERRVGVALEVGLLWWAVHECPELLRGWDSADK